MSVVLDPSLALSWYFEDEFSAAADAVLDRVVEEGAVVPAPWRLEIANGLQMAIRRKRITAAFRDNALAELAAMAINVDGETDAHAWSATLRLSDQFRLTVYDAAYLELARRRQLPLATLDQRCAPPPRRSAPRPWGAVITTIILGPSPALSAPELFTPTPKAAKGILEFFTAHVNNDQTRKAWLNVTRRFAAWCEDHGLRELAAMQSVHVTASSGVAGPVHSPM
jgi:predicted nucleic acid-binding protein